MAYLDPDLREIFIAEEKMDDAARKAFAAQTQSEANCHKKVWRHYKALWRELVAHLGRAA